MTWCRPVPERRLGYTWRAMMIDAPTRILRVGIVDYVNTLPLIDGLERIANLRLVPDVPSRLIDRLLRDEVDVALCSIIDYQRSEIPLKILPAGLLGCDGSTMTVRLFSRVPIEAVRQVHCDTDSHTSVALLRVLLADRYDIGPELIAYDARQHRGESAEVVRWPESMLLIGDKVVSDATPAIRYPYQMDLGAEWRTMTGLPFVFAAWMAKRDRDDVGVVSAILDRQRRHNLERIDAILAARAAERNWPLDLAREYVTDMICYEWTPRARAGAEEFCKAVHRLGLIDQNRPLVFDSGTVKTD